MTYDLRADQKISSARLSWKAGLFMCLMAVAVMLLGGSSAVRAADDAEPKGNKVTYHVHNGYFESNRSGLKGDSSYLAFTDQASFDKIFGIGRVMGNKQHFLPKNAFQSRMVVAVIKRGNSIWTYRVEKVTADKGTLYVQYKATAQDGGAATFASPLIVSLGKGKYNSVVFIENGKKAETLKIKGE